MLTTQTCCGARGVALPAPLIPPDGVGSVGATWRHPRWGLVALPLSHLLMVAAWALDLEDEHLEDVAAENLQPQRKVDGWMDYTAHGTGQGAWDYERRTREIQHLRIRPSRMPP